MRKFCTNIFAFVLTAFLFVLPVKAASTLLIGGSGADLGTMKLLGKEFTKLYPNIKVKVLPSLGSGGGVKALMANRLDLAVTSRELKAKEKRPNIQSLLYANTPFVFVSTPDYANQSVTIETLQKIYEGSQPFWPDGRQARAILRPPSDSDSKLLKSYLPGFSQALKNAYQRRAKLVAFTDQESADAVIRIPGAVGTSVLCLVKSEGRNLSPLTIDGVEPTVENLKNGRYKMKKPLYAVVSTDPATKVQNFLSFLQSDIGQKILSDTGHEPVLFKH